MRDFSNKKLLIVGIFSHNEEGIIEKTIKGVLEQRKPEGFILKIFIIANACTDRTEEIVREVGKENPEVQLISIEQKGKVIAMKKFIVVVNEYLKNRENNRSQNIVLMDADVCMTCKDTLLNLNNKLENDSLMDAIIPDWVPESVYNNKRDLVSSMYRVLYKIQTETKRERFRGMCYVIRLNVLSKINFIDNILNEDQFLQYKIRGKYRIVRDIKVVYGIPRNFRDEFKRRQRHAVALRQLREYYKLGKLEQVYGGNKDDPEYSLKEEKKSIVRIFIKINFKEKVCLLIILFFRAITISRAKRIYENLKRDGMMNEIWQTNR